MSNKITSYFSRCSKSEKQKTEESTSLEIGKASNENEMNTINIHASPDLKRKRIDNGDTLSPEQKRRMSTNKQNAYLIRLSKELAIVPPTIGFTWFEALQSELSKPYFAKLSQFVDGERKKSTVFPTAEKVWSWTNCTNIQDIRVVILGQDPYHGPGQAHGLCFSVMPGISPPPSLVNMYKELTEDIPGFTKPDHGHLVGWAKQGVLLLNSVLTVTSGRPNSHKDRGWEQLTDAVIRWISTNCTGVVFLLWGAYAQKKAAFVDSKRHHILRTTHPSPLSAHRGFLGCRHFSKCNEFLVADGKAPIDWSYLPK